MGDISEKEYEALGLNESLTYRDVTQMCCTNPKCEKMDQEKEVRSDVPPHSFIYVEVATEAGMTVRHVPMKTVCAVCMMQMHTISTEYFKVDEEEKYRFSAPKAAVDRGKDYYRNFKQQSWVDDPDAGKGATTLSGKDLANYKKKLDSLN
tara:strand:+ start:1733 stop:2182 length:450 start_codon:yes stop_codon:yes gene_type:complete